MRHNAPIVVKIDQDWLFKWLFVGLLTTEIVLVLLDAVISEYRWVSIGPLRRLVNITREDAIPNFFSSFQTLAVAVVLLLITIVARSQSRASNSKIYLGWGLVAGLFLFMSVDDGTKLHERIGSIFDVLVTDSSGEHVAGLLGFLHETFPSYSWQLVLGPFFAGMGVFMIVFLMSELPSSRLKGLALAGIGLFIVAVAMDFIEGIYGDPIIQGMYAEPVNRVADIFATTPKHVVHFAKSIEEFLEMAGATVFLFVFLKKLTSLTTSMTFELTRRQ